MSVQLNHTIVWCHDKQQSANFLKELLDLAPPRRFGPMLVVQLDNGVSLDFYEQEGKLASQHYAFLISEEDFDRVFARIQHKEIPYWADPGKQQAEAIYHLFGGRGIYFDDPNGHLLEVMTRPYEIDG